MPAAATTAADASARLRPPTPAPDAAAAGLSCRRALLVVPVAAMTLAFAALGAALAAGSGHPLDWALLALFVPAMAWESFVGWQLALGFAAWLRGPAALSPLERRAAEAAPVPTGRSRTAVLLPVYNEDAAAVYAAVRAMMRSLARTGDPSDVDLHILSDTSDPTTAAAEEREHDRLLAWADGDSRRGVRMPRALYRRRPDNAGRKAGNIADFCARWGDRYDFMIVLDADSLMTGGAMRRLIRLMEESPRVGLIQTVSWPANRETLFARIQQFAIRLYAPLPLRGLEFWQGPDGSYWGHNAILRIAPFAAHCRLPVLPGRPPLGGEILCHDIVEGALLRRAGWEVRLLPEFDGTWEEMPTNLVDLMGRERRWCQGNLQHARVLPMPGLKAASRAHIATGILGYLVSPLWFAFLALAALRALTTAPGDGLGLLAYGLTEPGAAAACLLGLSLALVLASRVLSVARGLLDPEVRRGFGGPRRFLASALLEQAFALLIGPLFLVVHTRLVASTLAGRVVPWDTQPRADREVGWAEAARRYAAAPLLGALLALAAWRVGGWYAAWMAPVALGLLVAPALVALSSRAGLGLASRRLGLFLTPDETDPAPELLAIRAGPSEPTPAAPGRGRRLPPPPLARPAPTALPPAAPDAI